MRDPNFPCLKIGAVESLTIIKIKRTANKLNFIYGFKTCQEANRKPVPVFSFFSNSRKQPDPLSVLISYLRQFYSVFSCFIHFIRLLQIKFIFLKIPDRQNLYQVHCQKEFSHVIRRWFLPPSPFS